MTPYTVSTCMLYKNITMAIQMKENVPLLDAGQHSDATYIHVCAYTNIRIHVENTSVQAQ